MKIINSFDFITKKITDIAACEIICLNALEYRLKYDTVTSVLRYFLSQGILLSTDMDYQLCSRVYHFAVEIGEQVIENIEYLKYSAYQLACGIIAYARCLTKLDLWDIIFEEAFKIKFSNFTRAFEFIKM
jgi:hypothetical protein